MTVTVIQHVLNRLKASRRGRRLSGCQGDYAFPVIDAICNDPDDEMDRLFEQSSTRPTPPMAMLGSKASRRSAPHMAWASSAR